MPTVKRYEVRGYVYTTDGKSHSYSALVSATMPSSAKARAEAQARHEYGRDFKKASLTPHEIK